MFWCVVEFLCFRWAFASTCRQPPSGSVNLKMLAVPRPYVFRNLSFRSNLAVEVGYPGWYGWWESPRWIIRRRERWERRRRGLNVCRRSFWGREEIIFALCSLPIRSQACWGKISWSGKVHDMKLGTKKTTFDYILPAGFCVLIAITVYPFLQKYFAGGMTLGAVKDWRKRCDGPHGQQLYHSKPEQFDANYDAMLKAFEGSGMYEGRRWWEILLRRRWRCRRNRRLNWVLHLF